MRFARNSVISLGAYGISTLLTLALSILIARLLGPAENGAFAVLMLVLTLSGMVMNLGLGQAIVYFVGQHKLDLREAAGNLLVVGAVLGLVTAMVILVLALLFGRSWFPDVPMHAMWWILLAIPFALGRLFAEYIFLSQQDFVWNAGLNILDLSMRLVLILVLMVTMGLSLNGLVVVVAFTTIFTSGVGWAKIRSRLGTLRLHFNGAQTRQFVRYGVPSYAANLATYLNLRLDQLLVGFFLPLSQLGIYVVAVSVAELPMKLANAVTKVVFAAVANSKASDAALLTNRTMRFVFFIALCTSAVLVMVGGWIVEKLFGSAYAAAAHVLWYLLPGAVLFNFTQILHSDLLGRGRPAYGLYASAASLTVTLAGNILLTPVAGLAGAAVTSSLSYAVSAVVLIWAYCRISGQTLKNIMLLTREDLALVWQAFNRRRLKAVNLE